MWAMEAPAVKVAECLSQDEHKMQPEVMRIDDETAAIVVAVDGVDYILTMTRVPVQRLRPVSN